MFAFSDMASRVRSEKAVCELDRNMNNGGGNLITQTSRENEVNGHSNGKRGHGYESNLEGIEFIISSSFLRYQEILASDKLMQYLFKDLPSCAWVRNSAHTGSVGACNTIIH